MTDEDVWEGTAFKLLSKNDSGEAAGHQAGFVVPKDIAGIFPALGAGDDQRWIRAILRVGAVITGMVDTRYQHQTWGGTRGGERRMTHNLADWLRPSRRDDIVLIERSVGSADLYRFTLLQVGDPRYDDVVKNNPERWGFLKGSPRMVDHRMMAIAAEEQEADLALPFHGFAPARPVTRQARIARSRTFAERVIRSYCSCAICGGGLRLDERVSELEAAHIIPVTAQGSDDPRNGFAICRAHHWAFDKGFLAVDEGRHVIVSPLADIGSLAPLVALRNRPIELPADLRITPHEEAFRWHRQVLFKAE